MSKTIRVGIIGYGLSGRIFHGAVIPYVDGFKVTSFSSSRPADVRADFPDVHVCATPEELITRDDVDLVVITSPNTTHYPLTKLALESGKHVVVEKPFVVDAEEGQELITLAEKHQRMLSVYQNRRWDNDFLTLQDLIQQGELGSLHTYCANWDRYRPNVRPDRWREQARPGSGILYDLGAHLIDQAIVLFGKPKSVWGDVQAQREGGVTDDYFNVNIIFEGGQRAIVGSGAVVTVADGHRIAAYGSKGAYTKQGLDNQEGDLRDGRRPNHPEWGRDTPGKEGILHLEEEQRTITSKLGHYQGYYEGVYRCITSGDYGNPPVKAADSVTGIQVIQAAQRSSQEGIRVEL